MLPICCKKVYPIPIYLSDGTFPKDCPKIYLLGVNSFDISAKKITLPEGFTVEKANFFIHIITNMFFDTFEISINETNIMWFYEILNLLREDIRKYYIFKFNGFSKSIDFPKPEDTLLKIIDQKTDHIPIFWNSTLLAAIPEIFLLSFDYFYTYFRQTTLKTQKEIHLPPNFNEQMAQFFVNFIPQFCTKNMESIIDILQSDPYNLLTFIEICDVFMFSDMKLVEPYVDKYILDVVKESMNFDMLQRILEFKLGEISSTMLKKVKETIIQNINTNPIIEQITVDSLIFHEIRDLLGMVLYNGKLKKLSLDSGTTLLTTVCAASDNFKDGLTFKKPQNKKKNNLLNICIKNFENKYYNFILYEKLCVLYPKSITENGQKLFNQIDKSLKKNGPILEQLQYNSLLRIKSRNYIIEIIKNNCELPEITLVKIIVN